MTRGAAPVPEKELARIYERRVAPDLLAGAAASPSPVAMIIAGQPGAGVPYATALLRKDLVKSVGTCAQVSVDRLRSYHPGWQRDDGNPLTAARVAADAAAWFDRFVEEVQAKRLNLVAEVGTQDAKAIPKLAAQLRRDHYFVQAVFVATSREESRIAMMARYEMRRRHGLPVEPISVQQHELAFLNVRTVMGALEHRLAVDGLRVIRHDGTQIYESRLVNEELSKLPRAQQTLDVLLDKARPPRELVQLAMRWETLVQRLANDPVVPRDIASQTLTWRNEAVARCESNPTTAQMLQWAREAGAFRVMDRFEFEKEFPHHSRAVKSLGLAVIEAEKYERDEGARLVFHARENIAQRIERGDMARIAAQEKTHEPPTR